MNDHKGLLGLLSTCLKSYGAAAYKRKKKKKKKNEWKSLCILCTVAKLAD